MPYFGAQSEQHLATVHPALQQILRKAIEIKDFTVICGHRGQADQHTAFLAGTSKVDWPHGNHNSIPSLAVDVWPYDPITHTLFPWSNEKEMCLLAGVILTCAHIQGIPLRWGHDWNNNLILSDEGHRLADWPHFELIH